MGWKKREGPGVGGAGWEIVRRSHHLVPVSSVQSSVTVSAVWVACKRDKRASLKYRRAPPTGLELTTPSVAVSVRVAAVVASRVASVVSVAVRGSALQVLVLGARLEVIGGAARTRGGTRRPGSDRLSRRTGLLGRGDGGHQREQRDHGEQDGLRMCWRNY